VQLLFRGLVFSWDVTQLRSARGIRCYSVIHPVPKESYIKIILFSLAPGKLGGRLRASGKDEGIKKITHHLKRGSGLHIPLLSHCTELGKSVLHCSAAVSTAIKGQFQEKKQQTTKSSLSHFVTAPFTETAQGLLFQGEDDDVERQDSAVHRRLFSIAWES